MARLGDDEPEARKHVTRDEVKMMVKAARTVGRNRNRDSCMILMAHEHGLRSIEVCRTVWDQIDIEEATFKMKRAKGGRNIQHDLTRNQIRALHKLPGAKQRKGYVFQTEAGGKMNQRCFHIVVARAGRLAGLDFATHPHMLRHGCGYHLAGKGEDTLAIRDYLGHRHITTTEIYTAHTPGRFKKFFEDE